MGNLPGPVERGEGCPGSTEKPLLAYRAVLPLVFFPEGDILVAPFSAGQHSTSKRRLKVANHLPASKVRNQHQARKPILEAAGWKRRFFFLVTLIFPVLILALLELGLRLIHYGPDLSPFTQERLNGKPYLVMNPSLKNRYFVKVDFTPSTSPDFFLMPKPLGTYRIFCLGGSTTAGYPYWFNGSFSSFLRDRLRAIFPDKGIEVINVGMTATNSFTVLDLARDLVGYEPDLFIVYDGHNEFYGALGAASRESEGRGRWFSLAYLRLIHFRIFLLMRDAYAWAGGLFHRADADTEAGTMMERLARGQYIPMGSEVYRQGLEIFRENLRDLTSICRTHHVPLILATQVSNLRDRPPFVSKGHEGTSPAEQQQYDRMMNGALTLMMDGKADSALPLLRRASGTDSLRAEPWYELGRALDTLGRRTEARAAYIRARDLDQLRFRASTDFNNAILAAADSETVSVVDMEAAFALQSPDSIIGSTLIVEHLHPNSSGYFLMARAYAAAMRERGLIAPEAEWSRRDTLDDGVLWAARPVTDLDERTAGRRTEVLTSGWPFMDQYPTVNAISPRDTIGRMAEMLSKGKWNWLQGHEEAAGYYAARGESTKVEWEYRTIVDQFPYDLRARITLAHYCLLRGELDDMKRELLASLELEKTILAYRALGDLALQQGHAPEALAYYGAMEAFPQSPAEQVDNGYARALAYARAEKKDSASILLLKVLRLRPDYQPAVELLAKLNMPAR